MVEQSRIIQDLRNNIPASSFANAFPGAKLTQPIAEITTIHLAKFLTTEQDGKVYLHLGIEFEDAYSKTPTWVELSRVEVQQK